MNFKDAMKKVEEKIHAEEKNDMLTFQDDPDYSDRVYNIFFYNDQEWDIIISEQNKEIEIWRYSPEKVVVYKQDSKQEHVGQFRNFQDFLRRFRLNKIELKEGDE